MESVVLQEERRDFSLQTPRLSRWYFKHVEDQVTFTGKNHECAAYFNLTYFK